MKHLFLVTVETDSRDIDAPTVEYISNEIQNNLEYEYQQDQLRFLNQEGRP